MFTSQIALVLISLLWEFPFPAATHPTQGVPGLQPLERFAIHHSGLADLVKGVLLTPSIRPGMRQADVEAILNARPAAFTWSSDCSRVEVSWANHRVEVEFDLKGRVVRKRYCPLPLYLACVVVLKGEKLPSTP